MENLTALRVVYVGKHSRLVGNGRQQAVQLPLLALFGIPGKLGVQRVSQQGRNIVIVIIEGVAANPAGIHNHFNRDLIQRQLAEQR